MEAKLTERRRMSQRLVKDLYTGACRQAPVQVEEIASV